MFAEVDDEAALGSPGPVLVIPRGEKKAVTRSVYVIGYQMQLFG